MVLIPYDSLEPSVITQLQLPIIRCSDDWLRCELIKVYIPDELWCLNYRIVCQTKYYMLYGCMGKYIHAVFDDASMSYSIKD